MRPSPVNFHAQEYFFYCCFDRTMKYCMNVKTGKKKETDKRNKH